VAALFIFGSMFLNSFFLFYAPWFIAGSPFAFLSPVLSNYCTSGSSALLPPSRWTPCTDILPDSTSWSDPVPWLVSADQLMADLTLTLRFVTVDAYKTLQCASWSS
jgi:hypothetical protein